MQILILKVFIVAVPNTSSEQECISLGKLSTTEILFSLKYSHFTAEAGNLCKCKSTKRTSASTNFSWRL